MVRCGVMWRRQVWCEVCEGEQKREGLMWETRGGDARGV